MIEIAKKPAANLEVKKRVCRFELRSLDTAAWKG